MSAHTTPIAHRVGRIRSVRTDSSVLNRYFLEIFAFTAASRSANHGCRVLQICGSSSLATAPGMVGDIRHGLDRRLGHERQLPRRRRRPGGHLLRAVQQLVVVDAAPHEPDPLRFCAVEHLAEHDRRHRRLRSGDAPEHPRVPAPGMQPELQEPGVEAGPPSSEADVTAEREVHPCPDGRAIDRGERGQRAAGDPQEPLVDVAEARSVGRRQVAEVGAGAERRRGARHDERPDRFVHFDAGPSPP